MILKIVTNPQIHNNIIIILKMAPKNVDSSEYFGFKITK